MNFCFVWCVCQNVFTHLYYLCKDMVKKVILRSKRYYRKRQKNRVVPMVEVEFGELEKLR